MYAAGYYVFSAFKMTEGVKQQQANHSTIGNLWSVDACRREGVYHASQLNTIVQDWDAEAD